MVPQLGHLYTPTFQNAATLGLIDSEDEDLVFSMDQMSFGTRSLIAIIAKVVTAKNGSWVCVEEPETYLHPQAQIGLFRFLHGSTAAFLKEPVPLYVYPMTTVATANVTGHTIYPEHPESIYLLWLGRNNSTQPEEIMRDAKAIGKRAVRTVLTK